MSDPTALPNFLQPSPEAALPDRVRATLTAFGLEPGLDDDGDIKVIVNDQQLYVRCFSGDVPVLRVFGQWQIADELTGDPAHMAEIANEVNLNLQCAKVGFAGGTLVCVSEHIAGAGEALGVQLQVGIQAVLACVDIWHKRMAGLDPMTGQPVGQPGDHTQGHDHDHDHGHEGPNGVQSRG